MANGLDKIPKPDRAVETSARRILSAGRLLLVLFIISVVQYVNTGKVTWVTDTFQWIERTTTGLADNPGATIDKAGEVINDVARRVGQSIPGTDSVGLADADKPQIDISWSALAFELSGKVVKIADGDTLTIVDAKGGKHKIRLYGIDTPEYDQPHYRAAKNALSRLVANKIVGIIVKDTDTYGRTVGVVFIEGRSVNLEMVRRGHAWWYKRYAELSQTLREAEAHARAYELGLWAEPEPEPVAPWVWRRQRR